MPRILDRLSWPWLDLPWWRSLLRLLELLGLRRLTRLFPRSFLETMVRVSEAFELALVSIVFVLKASFAALVAVLSRLLAPRARGCQKEQRKGKLKQERNGKPKKSHFLSSPVLMHFGKSADHDKTSLVAMLPNESAKDPQPKLRY
ncbi:MAG: hypothetical protein AB1664_16360 [Thermodesulfobacteriota bacterium]